MSRFFNSHEWADLRDHFFQQACLHGYPKLVKLVYREVSDTEYCDNDLTLIFANDAGIQWRIHYSPVERAVWIWNRERMTYVFPPIHSIDLLGLEQAPWEIFEDLQAASATPIYEIEYHPQHMHWVIR